MRRFACELRPLSSPPRPTAAWWLPEVERSALAVHLARCARAGVRIELCELPAHEGLLLLVDEGAPLALPAPCLPLARWAGRLYLPLDAQLWPPASEAEWGECLPSGRLLFLPNRTPVHAPPELSAAPELALRPPPTSARRWDRARPGTLLPPRLAGVSARVPSLEQTLADLREEVEPRPLDALEDSGSPTGEARGLRAGIARKILQWTSQAPQGAESPNWVDRLDQWARRSLGIDPAQLEQQRAAELSRLLELLQDDPDQGLRYALPLGAGETARGVAPPSARLDARDPRFDLSQRDRALPGDAWNVEPRTRARLTQKYYELAARELQLGRYRRAAYVYAHLLGNDQAAAQALERGRDWQEAAQLYAKTPRGELKAAACLERGGLLEEAARAWDAAGDPGRAAELYARLGDEERAQQAWERALDKAHAQGRLLVASRIAEQELRDPRRALRLLASEWPAGESAEDALVERLALLGRMDQRAQARQWVEELCRQELAVEASTKLARALRRTADAESDRTTSRWARDRARVAVSSALRGASAEQERALMKLVAELDSSDRLLERDAARWMRQRRRARRSAGASHGSSQRRLAWRLRRESQLEPGVDWWRAIGWRGGFAALGTRHDGELVLASGRDSTRHTQSLGLASLRRGEACLSLDPSDGVLAGWLPGPLARCARPGRPAQSLTESTGESLACAILQGGTAHLSGRPGSPARLSLHAESGELLDTRELDVLPLDDPLPELHMAAHGTSCWIAAGAQLHHLQGGQLLHSDTLPHPIRALVASPRYSRTRLLLALEEGVALQTRTADSQRWTLFASDLERPSVGFVRGGLAAADTGRVQLWTVRDGRAQLEEELDLQRSSPLAPCVFGGPVPFELGVLFEDGMLRWYERA